MKLYAACLASYNNGKLHGEWLDLEDYHDAADLQEDIRQKVLMTSPCPNVTVECPHCETGRRGMGIAEGRNFTGFYECKHCDGHGNHPSAEEWAAHDYDGEGLSQFGEYPNLEELLAHVQLIAEHGDAWLAYVALVGEHYATVEGFLDDYCGECESIEVYFREQLEDSGLLASMPENLRYYFDYEAYARDAAMDYGTMELNGATYIFTN